MERGQLFIISGPSGVGKTTIAKEVYKRLPWLASAVTYTTRQKRREAREDKVIKYVTEQEFQKLIDEGAFLEWARVHGNFYGTHGPTVLQLLASGKSVLLNIDVQGTKTVTKAFPEAFTIFIASEGIDQLENRIRAREDITEDEIQQRLRNIQKELTAAQHYQHRVVNREGKLDETIESVVEIVEHAVTEA